MNAAPASAPENDPHFVGGIVRETPEDAAAIDALVIAAFGPGRFAKTAERLRERSPLAAGFCLYEGEHLIGSVRLWSILTGEARSVFLGPIAVDRASRPDWAANWCGPVSQRRRRWGWTASCWSAIRPISRVSGSCLRLTPCCRGRRISAG